jgi:hypothetical protein
VLQELEVLQCRTGVDEILEVRRLTPIQEVVEVGDEGGIGEVLFRGEIV